MKTSINRILFLCVIFIVTAMIVSCSKPPSVVVETLPTEKQPQKRAKRLTTQKAKQAFSELDAEIGETQPQKRETPKSDVQDKTAPKESESSSVFSPAQSNFSTSLSPLTEEQKKEGWVEVTEEYYGANVTPNEAHRLALENARRSAIEEALGMEIRAQALQLRSENQQAFHQAFTTLSQSTVYGRIVEEEEPIWAPVENVQFRPGEPPIPLYRVTLRAKVQKEEGEPDPGFQVTLKLNDGKVTFLEADEMILHITPTQDCYITAFNVLSDNTVFVLFPPQGHTPKKVRARDTLSIPSEAEREQGRHFRVGLLPGKKQDIESVIVVATKNDIPFLPRETKEFRPDIAALSGKVVLPTYQSALEDINRWLVSIPLEQRAFDVQQYEIRKK